MQCGQDSDCNPSSVGGILGAYYGFSALPEKCVKGLNENGVKFLSTNLNFKQTVDACVKLMGDSVKTYATATDDGYTIGVNATTPVPYEQWPDMPTLEFTASVEADSTVKLAINALDHSGIKGIKLDMGDGNVFYEQIASYKYAKPGTYTITLTATNNNGNSAIATATVTTTADFAISGDDEDGYRNIAYSGYPICNVTAPVGSGDKNIDSIRDGKTQNVGSYTPEKQYDTYMGSTTQHEEHFGYIFTTPFEIDKVVFIEGMHFDNGGWFANGTLKLQVLIADGDVAEWKDIEATVSPEYPNGSTQSAFGSSFEKYTFEIEKTVCVGVRIIGQAGGSANFTSISELEAYGVEA